MFEVIEDSIRVGCGVITVAGVTLFFVLAAMASGVVILASVDLPRVGAFAGVYVAGDLFSFGYKKLKKLF